LFTIINLRNADDLMVFQPEDQMKTMRPVCLVRRSSSCQWWLQSGRNRSSDLLKSI